MLVYTIPVIAFLSSISPKIVAWTMRLLRPAESSTQARLRGEIREHKRRLAAVSMTDEFPVYARIERQLNRLQAEHNALASQTRTNELKMRVLITTITHSVTGVAMLYVVWAYGSQPVVQLPPAALFPLGYLLAVPGCALGGISAASWIIISTSVVRRTMAAVL